MLHGCRQFVFYNVWLSPQNEWNPWVVFNRNQPLL